MLIRYFYDLMKNNNMNYNPANGASQEVYSHWVQLKAFDFSGVDRASGRAATVYDKVSGTRTVSSNNRTLAQITDGDLNTARYYSISSPLNNTWIGGLRIDLGAVYDIEYIHVWHYYGDLRIYFNHEVAVSTDGSNWTVIQPPEGNAREKATGNRYYLIEQPSTNEKIYDEKITNLRNALNAARNKRSRESYSFTTSLASKALYDNINELRTVLKDATNGTDLSIPVVENDKIDATDAMASYIKKYLNNSTCNTGCIQACRIDCSGACGAGCSDSCGKECQKTCGGGCSINCTGTCAGGCGSDCQGGCGSSCVNTCGGNCAIYCQGQCSTGCSTECTTNCHSICTDSCVIYCQGYCYTTCKAVCYTGCSASCAKTASAAYRPWPTACFSSSCVAICRTNCQNSNCVQECTASCGGGCSNSCLHFCKTNCSRSCLYLAYYINTTFAETPYSHTFYNGESKREYPYSAFGTGCYTTNGCIGNCHATCSVSCVSGCNTNCGSACADACYGVCSKVCGGICNQVCSTSCGGRVCGTACVLTCGTTCSSGCGDLCGRICSSACSGGCDNTCTGSAS